MSAGTVPPSTPAAVTAERPDHRAFFHWLPWLIPMAAIAIPEILLIVIGTAKDSGDVSMGLATRSVDRGDLLIPVIIICAEAFRRWWDTTFTSTLAAGVACTCAFISGGMALIALGAYMLVISGPNTVGYERIAVAFTWIPLAFGLIAGTIAVGQTAPRKPYAAGAGGT